MMVDDTITSAVVCLFFSFLIYLRSGNWKCLDMLSILCLIINLTREKGGRIQKDILYFFVIHSFMKTKSETNRPDERKIHYGKLWLDQQMDFIGECRGWWWWSESKWPRWWPSEKYVQTVYLKWNGVCHFIHEFYMLASAYPLFAYTQGQGRRNPLIVYYHCESSEGE